jgi:CBS domain-containing protein
MSEKITARDIMRVPVFTAQEYMLVTEVIRIMVRNSITGLPVVDDDGNLLGIITWRMIMNLAIMGKAGNTRVMEAMSKQLNTYGPTCGPDTPVEQLLTSFAAYRINRMIVVDDSGLYFKILGIICRRDIISVMDQIYSK